MLDVASPQLIARPSHLVTVGGFDAQTRSDDLSSRTSATGSIRLGVAVVTELTCSAPRLPAAAGPAAPDAPPPQPHQHVVVVSLLASGGL